MRKAFPESVGAESRRADCVRMALNLSRLPFSRFFRQLEHDMETVVKVLQPGPLGIIEHKFSPEEIESANSSVNRALANWRRAAYNERNNPIMRDFIDVETSTPHNRG